MKTKCWITARLEGDGLGKVTIHGAGAWTKDEEGNESWAGRSRALPEEMARPILGAMEAALEGLREAAGLEGAAAGFQVYNVRAGNTNAPPAFGLKGSRGGLFRWKS